MLQRKDHQTIPVLGKGAWKLFSNLYMSTIYLHIGTMKTGTTAIQKFLTANRDYLEMLGCTYPKIQVGLSEKYKIRNGHFLVYPSDEEKTLDEEQVLREGFLQLKAAARQFDTVLLSDELIWHHWLKQPDFWQRLIQEVQNMNSTLKVVVYLRRQDLLAESLYNHIVKSKRMFTKDFSSYINGQAPKIFAFSYYEQIQQIASWIGKEYLLLRVYEEGQFGGEEHTLFSDFLEATGLPQEGFAIPDPASNLGLHGNYIEFKRIINQLPEYRQTGDFLSYPLRAASAARTEKALHHRESFFTEEEQRNFMARYQEGNRKLALEYLNRPDGVLFREPLGNLSTWKLNRKTLHEDLTIMMTEALCCQQRQINELEKRVKAAEENSNSLRWLYRKLKGAKDFS